jgi:hypothetical protein
MQEKGSVVSFKSTTMLPYIFILGDINFGLFSIVSSFLKMMEQRYFTLLHKINAENQ